MLCYNQQQKVFGQNWKSRTPTVNKNTIPVQRSVLRSQRHSGVSARWPGTSGHKLSVVWPWGYVLVTDFRFRKSVTLSTFRSPLLTISKNVVWMSASLDPEGLRMCLPMIYDKSFDIYERINLHGESIYAIWKQYLASRFTKIQFTMH